MSVRFASVFLIHLMLVMPATAQEKEWLKYNDDAVKAYQADNVAEAERLFLLAVAEAEKLPQPDKRLATSLANLAEVQRGLRKNDAAIAGMRRAIDIWEKAL